jgi:limonene-1,2-epoxide hydrolase
MRGSAIGAALTVALVAATAGCGSSPTDAASSSQRATTAAPPAQEHAPIEPEGDLAIPRRVPREGTGASDPRARRVIRAWLNALNHDDIERAASYFALPSKFQNGTPVLTVDSQQERIAVNLALPCGAKATEMRGAGDFTIVTFRLIDRPGGECGQGVGGRARGAIRVAMGKIVEWYRLPDVPGGEQIAPPAPSGPTV